MRLIRWVMFFISAAAFILAFALHRASLFGQVMVGGPPLAALYFGILAVGVPSALVNQDLILGYPKGKRREATFRGCPRWMKRLVTAVGWYTIVGFFGFILLHFLWPHQDGSDPATVSNMRILTLVLMISYATCAAVLYSGAKVLASGPRDGGQAG